MRQQQQRQKTPSRKESNADDILDSKPYQGGGGGRRQNTTTGKQASFPYSMYRETDPSQVKVNVASANYFGDQVSQLRQIGSRFNLVKEFKEESRIDPSVIVRDLSLKVRASEEDEAFAKTPDLWMNFRRGNTLLEFYDPKDYSRLVDTCVARKGLSKFFDISHDFISRDARYRDDYLNAYQTQVKNMIFAPVKRAMLEGHRVEAVRMLKANGENCQISYVSQMDAWVIASKNVGLVARNVDDIALYEGKNAMRYSFASLMARCWFTQISEFKKKDLESLKQDFSGRTFVGEFIGHPDCQHLVKYTRQSIVFYAMVNNLSKKICHLPEETLAMLKKYKLDCVRVQSIGVFNDYDHLCDELQQEFERVSGLSISEEEEGSVLYFILRHREDVKQDQVLSLGKLKTLEYRLFRKMREKLRDFASYATNASSDVLIERFIKQSRELCRDPSGKMYHLPHPFDFYVDICVLAFNVIQRGPRKEIDYFVDLLMHEYVHFLEEVLNVFEERNRGPTGKPKPGRYIGKVNFESTILEDQASINYTGPPGQRVRAVVKQTTSQQEEVKQTSAPQQTTPQPPILPPNPARKLVNTSATPTHVQTPTPSAPAFALGSNIVIFSPAFTLPIDLVEVLKAELGGNLTFIEADYYQVDMLKQHHLSAPLDQQSTGVTPQLNLIFINSLRGISNVETLISHTEKIYYFVVNYTRETLEKLRDREFEAAIATSFSGGSTRFEDGDHLHRYIDEEIQFIEAGNALAAIKGQRNVSFVHTENLEKDLLMNVTWAKSRLLPNVIAPISSTQSTPQKQPPQSENRKVSMSHNEPAPVLKKRVVEDIRSSMQGGDRPSSRGRADSESKKKVKINDIPEYATIQPKAPPAALQKKEEVYIQQVQVQRVSASSSNGSKTILVIMPVGIPGMGKSTFIETQLRPYFESQAGVNFVTFASDAIRKEVLDSTMAKNKSQGISKTRDQVFMDTGKRASSLFMQTLDQKIYEAIEDQTYLHHVICLDKNHPPDALNSTVESINKFVNSYSGGRSFDLVKVGMVPQMAAGGQNLHQDYPFSLSFLLQCFIRCLDRADHDTLTNADPSLLARVQVSFFKAYKGLRFEKEDGRLFAQRYGLDDLVKVPLTLEHADIEVPYNVQVCLDKCLKLTQGFGPAQPNEEFDRLVHLGNLYKSYFQGLTKAPSQDGRQVSTSLTDLNGLLERVFHAKFAPPANGLRAQNSTQQQPRRVVQQDSTAPQTISPPAGRVIVQQTQPTTSNLLTVREVTKKPQVIMPQTPQQPHYRPKVSVAEEKKTTTSVEDLDLTRQDSLGRTPQLEEQKSFKLRLNEDDGTPKFGDKEKHLQHFPEVPTNNTTTTPGFEVVKQRQVTQKAQTAGGPDELGFETTLKTRKDKKVNRRNQQDNESDESEDYSKIPLYLGITLHHDAKLMVKMREMIPDTLKKLLENDYGQVILDTVQSINQIWLNNKQEVDGWKKPDDYHVTTFFLGREEEKLSHELYTEFQADLEVPVEIHALVLVPNKIITGICFPNHPISNRCPHVTLMINGWKPIMSNSLLEECCTRGTRSPFLEAYEELKLNGTVKPGQEIQHAMVKVERNGPTSSCYFIALDQPVEFYGVTKVYE